MKNTIHLFDLDDGIKIDKRFSFTKPILKGKEKIKNINPEKLIKKFF